MKMCKKENVQIENVKIGKCANMKIGRWANMKMCKKENVQI